MDEGPQVLNAQQLILDEVATGTICCRDPRLDLAARYKP